MKLVSIEFTDNSVTLFYYRHGVLLFNQQTFSEKEMMNVEMFGFQIRAFVMVNIVAYRRYGHASAETSANQYIFHQNPVGKSIDNLHILNNFGNQFCYVQSVPQEADINSLQNLLIVHKAGQRPHF